MATSPGFWEVVGNKVVGSGFADDDSKPAVAANFSLSARLCFCFLFLSFFFFFFSSLILAAVFLATSKT
jgi:hypothetical protein